MPRLFSWRRAATTKDRARFVRRPIVCEALESRMLLSGASLVKDINPGPGSSVAFGQSVAFGGSQEVALGSKFIFAATDATHGMEPWVSDGTPTGTVMLKDINTSGSSSPNEFTVGNGVVYFTANNGTSTQIWKTAGIVGDPVPVTAVPSTPDARQAVFAVFSGTTLFFTEDGDNMVSSLCAMDPTKPGTETELTTFGGISNSLPIPIAAANGILFLTATDGNGNNTLWTATAAGANPITINQAGTAGIGLSAGILNGLCFFSAFGGVGEGLWRSDGTQAGTFQVGSTSFFNGSTSPQDFTVSGNTLYFVADDGHHGTQIWSTDGTNVTPVTSLNTTTGSIQNLTDVNGTLFFSASTGGTPKVLYRLVNGAATQVPLPSDGSGTIANQLANVNGTLFFSAQNASGQQTLFDFDGTSISPVQIDPGLNPLGLLNVTGTLFYSADEPATGRELYSATPTATTELSVDLGGASISIDEGDKSKVAFHATVTGGTAFRYGWNFTGKGKLKIVPAPKGADESFSYTKFPVGFIHVTVVVRTKDGRTVQDTQVVQIMNVPPQNLSLSATVPKSHVFVSFLPIQFTVRWSDPGVNDTFSVDWKVTDIGVSSTFEQLTEPAGKNHISRFVSKIRLAPGAYTAAAEVTDKDGGKSGKNFDFVIVA